MICTDLKCVFVHIPKVAGQSIERFFFHNLLGVRRETLLLKSNTNPSLGPQELSHLAAEEYVRLGYMTPEQFNSYYKFSFVRNPWTRMVSEYIFSDYISQFKFKDFIFKHFPKPNLFSDSYRHVLPQYDFIYDSKGNCIVDFVGRFERLQIDFDTVCKQLGIKDTKLPHLNSAKNNKSLKEYRPYWEYYDDETKEFVADFYHKDIETFGYAFGE